MKRLSNFVARDIFRYHHSLLSDTERTDGYRAAIESVVRPEHVVADLGCGSGILSMFAARAGARHVYAIDEHAVIALAREFARDNGLADRITFIEASSYDVSLPEPADVLVTEIMGNGGVDEGIVLAVADACKRWLKPGAIIVPRAIELIAAPVERELDTAYWLSRPYDFDLSRAASYLANIFDGIRFDAAAFVADPRTIARVGLTSETEGGVHGTADFIASRSASIAGIALWFRAELTEQITITNAPPDHCPSWKNGYFPLRSPVAVDAGDRVSFDLRTYDGVAWKWSVSCRGATIEQSSLENYPFWSAAAKPPL